MELVLAGHMTASSAKDTALAEMADPAVTAALRGLPSHLATTVYLADAEGYRYAVVAEITGVRTGGQRATRVHPAGHLAHHRCDRGCNYAGANPKVSCH